MPKVRRTTLLKGDITPVREALRVFATDDYPAPSDSRLDAIILIEAQHIKEVTEIDLDVHKQILSKVVIAADKFAEAIGNLDETLAQAFRAMTGEINPWDERLPVIYRYIIKEFINDDLRGAHTNCDQIEAIKNIGGKADTSMEKLYLLADSVGLIAEGFRALLNRIDDYKDKPIDAKEPKFYGLTRNEVIAHDCYVIIYHCFGIDGIKRIRKTGRRHGRKGDTVGNFYNLVLEMYRFALGKYPESFEKGEDTFSSIIKYFENKNETVILQILGRIPYP